MTIDTVDLDYDGVNMDAVGCQSIWREVSEMRTARAAGGWKPGTLATGRPTYVALADALAGDIARGRLNPGDRLPTHRALARVLGVTVGTVARAYAEAERRGLVGGEVGRGTFVRAAFGLGRTPDEALDLAALHPPLAGLDPSELLGATLRELAADPVALRAVTLTDASRDAPSHCAAAATWLTHGGFTPEANQVLLTAGAQHAVTVVLLALAEGGPVATTPLTNPGLIAAARQLGLPLCEVAADADGMLPDALEAALAAAPVRVVHLQPTLDNPTGRTAPAHRREALARVCERAGVWVIEDDPLGALAPQRPDPIAALLPAQTCHVSSASKTLALGLRLGTLVAPEPAHARLAAAVRSSTWLAAPLLGEVFARWVADGTATSIVAGRRKAVAARATVAASALEGLGVQADPASPHLWLPLPEQWSVGQFVAAAREEGVLVASGDDFAARRAVASFGVRVGLNAEATDDQLRDGLLTLVRLLANGDRAESLA
jgi:DNA-binding transcriptional MocR family regulator